ncbi:ATP-dependent 6-phosphofructokinase [Aplysia californica]|uniref:6-phosphofructokinase n=1 Tax=Aplysia californica TaxID=6500 RepID=A0ABM1A4P4_APLCA|nr:ATP-dependent 6-phosphofructokinase [Aplysia californica]
MESNTYVPAYYARRQTLMRKSMAAISASRFDQSTARLLSSVENRSHNSWLGATVGVVTAGDDSQGMNACIRAVVRLAMYLGCDVYYIKQGFKGMVDGGENIVEATWISTSDVIGHGGTILKSYKCPSFTERESRLKAVHNLLKAGISNIIAIGGDGTLRALNVLHEEWPLLLRELHDRNQITRELAAKHKTLRAVGIISSIVHDVCGSDVAIGVDSALHRIIEATDAIATTSSSSQQVFVVEVMGKKSGYLALTAGLACDASMIFIPEWPPEGDWTEELVNKIKEDVAVGKEGILVVVSEGATDRQGKPIKAEEIRAVLARKLNLDTRVTVLGHVQRGGIPSASDRYLASRMGAESVLALRDLPEDMSACAIGMVGNNVSCLDIGYCLENTEKVWQCMLDKNYTEAVRLRGRLFQSFLSSYAILHSLRPAAVLSIPGMSGVRKIGVVKIGKTTLGHCCVTKSVVGYCLSK